MFEHVGKSCFQEYFNQVAANLKDDGVALIHTIGRPTPPQGVNRFITKYIFPGGYIPSLSQITTVAEKSGLLITDIECLYLHYAETLRHWRINFLKNRKAAIALYDERFARIWELYLAGCEASFRAKSMLVYQVQLRKPASPVSLTRDYLYTADS
jgi:cyclopropane-fatty-acyl-phospholipid synthase